MSRSDAVLIIDVVGATDTNPPVELDMERVIEKLIVNESLLLNNDGVNTNTVDTTSGTFTNDVQVVHNDIGCTKASEDLIDGSGITEDNTNDDDTDKVILPSSDLSDTNRRIWIITTAGLPWMTGTAVNPLLRALALAKDRPSQYVTLMIPWLLSNDERTTLYGKNHNFQTQFDQENWIRQYCVERCNCSHEVAYEKLKILFWYGKYHEGFGSIFPLEDICSTIPRAEADICILEEPEHLNWFRVPATTKKKDGKYTKQKSSSEDDRSNSSISKTVQPEIENPFEIETGTSTTLPDSFINSGTGTTVVESNNSVENQAITARTIIKEEDIEILGWAHKFQHVVGILHTNYGDYIRQYGMASMVTAPALNALSSLVVKAYCHKVIRLSETLPPLDPTKEVTCNVHGVRHEFLDPPVTEPDTMLESKDDSANSVPTSGTNENVDTTKLEIAPVYFIGKLIWAKGFERVLELQERYKLLTTEYFPIDIYGGGKDEKEIQTAFFGRNGANRGSSSLLYNESDQLSDADKKIADEKAAAVFGSATSLRDQICGDTAAAAVDDDDYVLVANAAASVGTMDHEPKMINHTSGNVTPPDTKPSIKQLLATPDVDDTNTNTATVVVQPPSTSSLAVDVDAAVNKNDATVSPIEVLGDISGKTITTTVDTADATLKLIDSAMKAGFNIFSGNSRKNSVNNIDSTTSPKNANNTTSNQPNPFQNIAPAKTRFKVSTLILNLTWVFRYCSILYLTKKYNLHSYFYFHLYILNSGDVIQYRHDFLVYKIILSYEIYPNIKYF
jgi:hypothetical protein